MGFASHSFPNSNRQDEVEAERLAQQLLERVRLAHRRQPEGVVRQPIFSDQFRNAAGARVSVMSRPLRLMRENPEGAFILLCIAFCAVGTLQHAMI